MTGSRFVPSVPGFYWMKQEGCPARIVEIELKKSQLLIWYTGLTTSDSMAVLNSDDPDISWAGPIAPPISFLGE